MTVSRRTFIASAAAGSVLAAVGVAKLAAAGPSPFTARLAAADASAPGDVVGKIAVGYQRRRSCSPDRSFSNAASLHSLLPVPQWQRGHS